MFGSPDVELALCFVDTPAVWPALGIVADPQAQPRGLDPFLIPPYPNPWHVTRSDKSHMLRRNMWTAKRSTAVWRGSATGPRVDLKGWRRNLRARLTVVSRRHPDLVDAVITGWPQSHGNLSLLSRLLRIGPPAPFSLYESHKYVLDVDGNVIGTAGPLLLSSRSVLLVASRWRDAYSASKERLPHVIPLQLDLSDLPTVVQCLQRHNVQVFKSVRRGSSLAAKMMTRESILGYWADLLFHYAALQRFVPRKPEAGESVEASRLLVVGRRVHGVKEGDRRHALAVSAGTRVAALPANSLAFDLLCEITGSGFKDFVSFVDLHVYVEWLKLAAAVCGLALAALLLFRAGSRSARAG